MQKIAMQPDLFADRPSDGVHLAHAESQYKEDENVQQMPAFENPAGTEEHKKEGGGNALEQYATRVPQNEAQEDGGEGPEVDLHRQHFEHTLTALQFIRNHLTVVDEQYIQDKLIFLPDPLNPDHKKVLIFDMDETLIHCVDDIET